MREQQAQEAFDAQAADLKESVRAGADEAAELRAQLASVVPRDQLTAAEQRIKVTAAVPRQSPWVSSKASIAYAMLMCILTGCKCTV